MTWHDDGIPSPPPVATCSWELESKLAPTPALLFPSSLIRMLPSALGRTLHHRAWVPYADVVVSDDTWCGECRKYCADGVICISAQCFVCAVVGHSDPALEMPFYKTPVRKSLRRRLFRIYLEGEKLINLQATAKPERATTSKQEERAPGVRVEKVASKPVVSDPRYGMNVCRTGKNVSVLTLLSSLLWPPFLSRQRTR